MEKLVQAWELTIGANWDILPAVGVPAPIGFPKPALGEMLSRITFPLKNSPR
jgi:hypothetical protein